MVNSMTGYAAATGGRDGYRWSWEIRTVNAKGLDIRLRLPDWLSGLEQPLRGAIGKALGRGNVALSLRISRDAESELSSPNPQAVKAVLASVQAIEAEAKAAGLSLAPVSALDVLAQRGVLGSNAPDEDAKALNPVLLAEFDGLLAALKSMRADEGAALTEVIDGQLTQIADLTEQAAHQATARGEKVAENLRENLARVLRNVDGADPDRVAQELALLAVKSDVTEELDRLRAHVDAARTLMKKQGPVGRKLDFLMQEFNREANTLCSKAQAKDLTRTGLDLKTVIDQMREQVQNVE
ncbi:hypothetical protein ACMU_07790 [Actibacterium mucosum KCTC 23349]|uniref:YicC family protein n=1 Tax=Actibacterium mucosum KCTC 23349 TaxID=1454373 RepID=A0A037ZPS4_9RHOB|nr:YicC/YloC family endoribonuclease [Actibacterium mucosum]KAJ56832.1 hypothetical protein ACMU_07790 [Actibacterium mucosum KCTC 23349]